MKCKKPGKYDRVKAAGRTYAKRAFGLTEYDFLDLDMFTKAFVAGYKYAIRKDKRK